MSRAKINIILGPPGTGKTTQLIDIVEKELEKGTKPSEICYLAFTRRAALEAIHRSCDKFKLDRSELPYFRTIHSLCYQELGLTRDQVIQKKHLIELGSELGIDIRCKGNFEEGGIWGTTTGDRIVHLENLSRISQKSLKETWENDDTEDVHFEELDKFSRAYNVFKESTSLLDFSDMLQLFDHRQCGPFKLFIVDEAQDLSTLQWTIVNNISKNSEVTYVAGDDDQSIYGWAGANTSRFINLQGSVKILDQSYRLPRRIRDLAFTIQESISNSREKKFKPTTTEGEVCWASDIEEIDLSTGTWLLLARNTYQLGEFEAMCTRRSIPHETNKTRRYRENTVTAIRSWTDLTNGKHITGKLVKNLKQYIGIHGDFKDSMKYNLKYLQQYGGVESNDVWYEALTEMVLEEKEFWISALRLGEKITEKPRIRISTIHGAKGAEADHVALVTDISRKAYDRLENDPNDEHRVFYVGVTRAKQSLTIISPRTRYYYEI